MLFDWDSEKAEINRIKHGVRFEEAATVFEDPRSLELLDSQHSTSTEERAYRIGCSQLERVLSVVFTLRRRLKDGTEITRIISARPASRQERALYHDQDDSPPGQGSPKGG